MEESAREWIHPVWLRAGSTDRTVLIFSHNATEVKEIVKGWMKQSVSETSGSVKGGKLTENAINWKYLQKDSFTE
jgi:hypothetical protein